MKRLNDRQVILSRKEQQAYRLFDSLLHAGDGIDVAVAHAQDAFGPLDPAFVDFLRGVKA